MACVDDPRIIVALDFPDPGAALELAQRLTPEQCRLKVGKELFTRAGPGLVERLAGLGFQVFLDLKFHDIPNTVAAACAAAADLGVWMLNVHSLGGRRMLEAARERVAASPNRPLLIAVTVLTSMDQADLAELGLSGTPEEIALRLARIAQQCGLDGMVCSPREASALRAALGSSPVLVTPGVRPASADLNDQRRVMTPAAALAAGASYLVIGRPITAAEDPVKALAEIQREIAVRNH
jgi:orotidine-5'-phosphate decarboxylase